MLIICPECNNQVSDKAETCPHCGIRIAGNIINTQASQQVYTQQPTQQVNVQQAVKPQHQYSEQPVGNSQQPNIPVQGKQPEKRSNTTLIVSFIIALIICGVGYYFYNNAEKQKAEQEAYEYAMQSTDPMVLQNYLSQYMDAPSEHRDSVNAHLNMMQMEDTEWQNAVNSGSRGELIKYIESNPSSPHIAEAKNKVDSIDYSKASRDYKATNSIDALKKYLQEHPNGKYSSEIQDILDELKNLTVSAEEIAAARDVCKKFFQAINSKSESKLLNTVTDFMSSFLNRTGASSDDVVSFMNKLYKDDITNMNWHILDDFKAEKVDNGEGGKNIKVQFGAEQRIERTDPNKEKYGKYIISAEISPEGKISKFNMKKIQNVN